MLPVDTILRVRYVQETRHSILPKSQKQLSGEKGKSERKK